MSLNSRIVFLSIHILEDVRMTIDTAVSNCDLLGFLRKKSNGAYHSKLMELREAVDDWLNYIPQTFPGYTRHTVKHSDQIILQLSQLLFDKRKLQKSLSNLSAVEAYILCAAAYLHDAGMVMSDEEKARLLRSSDWSTWVASAPHVREQLGAIDEFRRNRTETPDDTIRNFLGDVQFRRVVAEYVRGKHPDRAAAFMTLHQSALGRFAYDDHELLATIAAVCRGHGLHRAELDDNVEYPLLRQIRGENANVRLLAILFRLGDLLDMHTSRACPLAMNAASPISTESQPHWTQYSAIKTRAFSPSEIQIHAECQNADQHKVLADWCQWIVDEVTAAPALLARSALHADWRPPKAAMAGASLTIKVEPARDARYRPVTWRFELDVDSVIARLSDDMYGNKRAFVRELIQNSLDASRCRMYRENAATNLSPNPCQVPLEVRSKYPIAVSISESSDASGNATQLLTVSDFGIGMSEETISKHFLQIGRSYYRTEDFRRSYGFTPNSKFGVGFLSVFKVAKKVRVETRSFDAAPSQPSISMSLSGPRNYIVVEESDRRQPGTQISLELRSEDFFQRGKLRELVENWCPNVELPIVVTDFGQQSAVSYDFGDTILFDIPDVEYPDCRLTLHRKSKLTDVGAAQVLTLRQVDKDGVVNLARMRRYTGKYQEENPHAEYIDIPSTRTTHAGIVVPTMSTNYRLHYTLDIRTGGLQVNTSRESPSASSISSACLDLLDGLWSSEMTDHLSDRANLQKLGGWKYIQKLSDQYPFSDNFWAAQQEGLEWVELGQTRLGSFQQLQVRSHLHLVVVPVPFWASKDQSHLNRLQSARELLQVRGFPTCIFASEVETHWSQMFRRMFEASFVPVKVLLLSEGTFSVEYKPSGPGNNDTFLFRDTSSGYGNFWWSAPFDGSANLICVTIGEHTHIIVNDRHKSSKLLTQLAQVIRDRGQFANQALLLMKTLQGRLKYLHLEEASTQFFEKWNSIENLPDNLKIDGHFDEFHPEDKLLELGMMLRKPAKP